MNICVLTQTFPRYPGDTAAPFMEGLCTGLHKAGNNVFVLAPFSPLFKNYKKNKNFKLHTYKYILPDSWHLLGYSATLKNDINLKYQVYLLSPFMFIFGIIALITLIKKEKIDVVSAHWILPNGFIAAVAKKITGVKIVSTLPGSDVYVAKQNTLFKKMALFAANNSDGVTSNSLQLKKDLEKLGAKIKKFQQIVYTVNSNIFKPNKLYNSALRKKLKISNNDTIILGIGRMVEKKGFLYLIKAIPQIIAKNKYVTFVLVGEGDERKILEKNVFELRLADNVRFTGNISYKDLPKFYNLADIFILPSVRDSEGNLDDQSVSVMEAMSCGKAVVTTDFPGYRLVIKNGENGYLVGEKNIKEIAKILISLIESQEIRNKIAKNARKDIISKFTWEKIGKQYSNFFKTL